jgi:hypothetical protein
VTFFGIPIGVQPTPGPGSAAIHVTVPARDVLRPLNRRDHVNMSGVASRSLALPPASDPVGTSMFKPDATWAQAAVANEFRALGVGFHPNVVVDRTSFVDDHSDVVHLARFKFSPTLRKLTQGAMVDTSFMHLIRHETAHAFFNLTWKPQLTMSFAAAFGRHDAPYDLGVIDQALSGLRRQDRPEFVSDYAQEHPCEDFAETFAVYLRFQGDAAGLERYIQAKGNSPVLRRKFDYVARLIANNRREFP